MVVVRAVQTGDAMTITIGVDEAVGHTAPTQGIDRQVGTVETDCVRWAGDLGAVGHCGDHVTDQGDNVNGDVIHRRGKSSAGAYRQNTGRCPSTDGGRSTSSCSIPK